MRTDLKVVVFGSPMAVGHVRPLMPLAARLVALGFDVVWAISGDPSEPASVWKEPLAKIGVTFIDLDAVAPFARNDAFPTTSAASVYPRVLARTNDVAEGAAIAIAAVVAGRAVVAGVNDYFALWAYVAMRKLGIVTKMARRMGPPYSHWLKHLYSSVARAALRCGAVVVASTTVGNPEDFGVDEAALGAIARDRVIAMSFVPQPLLFAHGLVDVMLTHGGANTFHETVLAGIPVLVWPVFGDQESVAETAGRLGIGVPIETPMYPKLAGAQSLARIAEETLPRMLAPGESEWKSAASRLAERVKGGDGLDTAATLVAG